MNKLHRMFLI